MWAWSGRVTTGPVDGQTYGALMRRTPGDHRGSNEALGAGIAGTGIYLTVTDETSPTSSSSQAPAPEPPAEPAADPYEVYLDLAPADAAELSREDAQARAMLGCGRTWAPGTVDAALAEAYAELCADMEERTG
ncbi:hypothetical protein [Salinispora arenicola]|uniref:hypothetical protein n=1 Tax=Salinispora arenicola TaxID=168697 RepID=UPI00207A3CAF|nr:hypothetical protein [Salinispora arenicola]MCN0180116.1 hypothetical protein [Salinispora arenicola]